MPRKSFNCSAEITVDYVTSSGTRLPNNDDVYVTIEMFGIVQRTRLKTSLFPLVFNETLAFEKTFWSPHDPSEVLDMLQDVMVSIELRQVTDVYLGGCLLAYFDTNARDFLYPDQVYCPLSYPRELFMKRTIDFPGLAPKLNLTTRAVIGEAFSSSYLRSSDSLPPLPYRAHSRSSTVANGLEDSGFQDMEVGGGTGAGRSNRRRSRSRTRHRSPSGSYSRQTVSSVMRSRSPSPAGRHQRPVSIDFMEDPGVVETPVDSEIRPPFVVRKVTKDLIGRTPILHDSMFDTLKRCRSLSRSRLRPRSASAKRYRSHWAPVPHPDSPERISCDPCNLTYRGELSQRNQDVVCPQPPKFKASRDPTTQRPVYSGLATSKRYDSQSSEDDAEVEALMTSVRPYTSHNKSLSHRLSPAVDCYAERIHRRVDDALRRNHLRCVASPPPHCCHSCHAY